jgi:hypothetical protein
MKEALEPWQRILRGAGAALEKAICRSLTREADGKPDVASSHAAHWGDYRNRRAYPVFSGMLQTVGQKSPRGAHCSCAFLETAVSLAGDSALHPPSCGGSFRAAERELVTERTTMLQTSSTPADNQTSSPRLCRHRDCRRTGACQVRKLRSCSSPAPRRPLTDEEWSAKMDEFEAKTRLIGDIAKLLNMLEAKSRPR